MKIIVSGKADNDLMQIFSYLSQQSAQVAQSVPDDIDRCFANLSSFPLSGSPRTNLGRDVRSIVVSPYLILDAARRDHVTILRVLHGSRDIEAEFRR
ncbi:MAG TPA: type II toxin-antitoxin system RelE/ParE family toxin [Bradyrhizobium sp.]|nr:type II toxin-antitoxin system RelE/ParE family toxin [Bradyrhizobium sp.]